MSNHKVVGYLLQEASVAVDPIIIEDTGTILRFKARLQDFDVNRNKRRYSKEILTKAHKSEMVQELIKTRTMFGEANHPFSNEPSRQMQVDFTRTSHLNTSFIYGASDITGIVETTGQNQGPAMRSAVVDNKSQIAFSMRGIGDVEQKKGFLDVTKLMVRCYDWVTFPSHKTAYMESNSNIMTESHIAGISKSDLDSMQNYLTESSGIVSSFVEQFGIEKPNVILLQSGCGAIIESADGTRVLASIEDDIRYDFRQFMSNR